MRSSLCWRCANACGKCSWSDRSFTPVKGWKAVRTESGSGENYMVSYLVIKCPEFKKMYTQLSKDELAKILNISVYSIHRFADEVLVDMCKMKGFKLKVGSHGCNRYFYLIH